MRLQLPVCWLTACCRQSCCLAAAGALNPCLLFDRPAPRTWPGLQSGPHNGMGHAIQPADLLHRARCPRTASQSSMAAPRVGAGCWVVMMGACVPARGARASLSGMRRHALLAAPAHGPQASKPAAMAPCCRRCHGWPGLPAPGGAGGVAAEAAGRSPDARRCWPPRRCAAPLPAAPHPRRRWRLP